MPSPAARPITHPPAGGRRVLRWCGAALAVATAALAIAAISGQFSSLPLVFSASGTSANSVSIPVPLGLLPLPVPTENPLTPAGIELGERLFFDKRLSRNQTLSCASCHAPEQGFSTKETFASGANGEPGRRHPPTLVNIAYNTFQFWDGRTGGLGETDSLERQSLQPIQDPQEMDLDPAEAARRLNAEPDYRERFQRAYGGEATPARIAQALASFERTLLFGNSPYDRFVAGNQTALSPAAIRGKELFFWKATCSACHRGANFTDDAFHPSVASKLEADTDPGRFATTQDEADRGAFKTPTLRDVSRRSPYMHDGSLQTLEEVVARYNAGGFDTHYWSPEKYAQIKALIETPGAEGDAFRKSAAPNLRAGFALHLSAKEQAELVAFLREGLTSDTYPQVSHRASHPEQAAAP